MQSIHELTRGCRSHVWIITDRWQACSSTVTCRPPSSSFPSAFLCDVHAGVSVTVYNLRLHSSSVSVLAPPALGGSRPSGGCNPLGESAIEAVWSGIFLILRVPGSGRGILNEWKMMLIMRKATQLQDCDSNHIPSVFGVVIGLLTKSLKP